MVFWGPGGEAAAADGEEGTRPAAQTARKALGLPGPANCTPSLHLLPPNLNLNLTSRVSARCSQTRRAGMLRQAVATASPDGLGAGTCSPAEPHTLVPPPPLSKHPSYSAWPA